MTLVDIHLTKKIWKKKLRRTLRTTSLQSATSDLQTGKIKKNLKKILQRRNSTLRPLKVYVNVSTFPPAPYTQCTYTYMEKRHRKILRIRLTTQRFLSITPFRPPLTCYFTSATVSRRLIPLDPFPAVLFAHALTKRPILEIQCVPILSGRNKCLVGWRGSRELGAGVWKISWCMVFRCAFCVRVSDNPEIWCRIFYIRSKTCVI